MIQIDAKKPIRRQPEESGENLIGVAGFILALLAVVAMGGSWAVVLSRGAIADQTSATLLGIFTIGAIANAFAVVICLLGLCYSPRSFAFAGLLLSLLGIYPAWLMFG